MRQLFLFIISIHADTTEKSGFPSCPSNINDNGSPAFITFYGDSLGDFVDLETHGIFGWDEYLKIHNPGVNWRVQNMAVAGWRTGDIIKLLGECVHSSARENFVTSNHVAFEIGGNDMVDWIPTLIFMPWKYFSYPDPITGQYVVGANDRIIQNTRVITRILRHPQVDKDVLVMGNFPGLSYSPSLGHIGDYFDGMKKALDDTYTNATANEHITDNPYGIRVFLADLVDYLVHVVPEYLRNVGLFIVLGPLGLTPAFTGQEDFDMRPNAPEREGIMAGFPNAPDWYVEWVYKSSVSWTTSLSLGLGLMQPGLEAAAMEERNITRNQAPVYSKIVKDLNGDIDESLSEKTTHRTGGNYVHFLPLYHNFVRWKDCFGWGQCWVGEPLYFRDGLPGHINALGYLVWSRDLANKVVELGWHNDTTLRNDGKVVGTTEVSVSIETADTTPQTSPIDWVLLFCILFGKCW